MNFPERCNFCLREVSEHLFNVPCNDAEYSRRYCSIPVVATVSGSARKLLQERNEAMAYVKQLEATINPVREWFSGDGEITDVVQMLTEAISELQKDRKELLRLGAAEFAEACKAGPQVDWYSPQEVREWLVRNNYSAEIGNQIAGLFAEHMQKSFDKGHEVSEHKVTELELKVRAADALVKAIDKQVEMGLMGARTAISDARLDYGTPFKYDAKEHIRIAALEEDLKNAMEFIEYVRDATHHSQLLREAAKKMLKGEDW